MANGRCAYLFVVLLTLSLAETGAADNPGGEEFNPAGSVYQYLNGTPASLLDLGLAKATDAMSGNTRSDPRAITNRHDLALNSAWTFVANNWGDWFLPESMGGTQYPADALPALHAKLSEEMTFTCYCNTNGNNKMSCSEYSESYEDVEGWAKEVRTRYAE
jgi:hypothetical protein